MSAVLMDGKLLASKVREEVKTAVAAMVAAGQAPPGLATVLIGDDPASEIYVRNKRRMCVEAGMQDHHQHLPGNVSHQEAIDLVDALAVNPLISGILVQLPVPGTIVAEELLSRIPAAKDVDGLTVANAGLLAQGLPGGHRPCTPAGIVRLLDEYAVALEGATAVVVGRSRLVGKPMAQLLLERNATVTIAHSRTRNLTEVCRNADILIAAAGVPGVITGDAIRPGGHGDRRRDPPGRQPPTGGRCRFRCSIKNCRPYHTSAGRGGPDDHSHVAGQHIESCPGPAGKLMITLEPSTKQELVIHDSARLQDVLTSAEEKMQVSALAQGDSGIMVTRHDARNYTVAICAEVPLGETWERWL